jgi:uroporphyrinogen-III synthase
MSLLTNKTFLLTRAEEDNEKVSNFLKEQGAAVISWPVFSYKELSVKDYEEQISNLDCFDWLIFTSPRSVAFFVQACEKMAYDIESFSNRIACVGEKTAAEVKKNGFPVDLVPKTKTSEGLVEEKEFKESKNLKILIPGAEDARGFFEKELGIQHNIVSISLYRKEIRQPSNDDVKNLLQESIEWILFYSPSAVRCFIDGMDKNKALAFLKKAQIAVIGPVTAEFIKEQGLTVDVIAEEPSTEKLIERISTFERSR